jgi:hypothetical protein
MMSAYVFFIRDYPVSVHPSSEMSHELPLGKEPILKETITVQIPVTTTYEVIPDTITYEVTVNNDPQEPIDLCGRSFQVFIRAESGEIIPVGGRIVMTGKLMPGQTLTIPHQP